MLQDKRRRGARALYWDSNVFALANAGMILAIN
jgi:hypothetical protein